MSNEMEQEAMQALINHLNSIDKVNATMNRLTETCFNKCVQIDSSSKTLTNTEGQCVINCVSNILNINGKLIADTFKAVGMFRF